jgi:hypothetical protein
LIMGFLLERLPPQALSAWITHKMTQRKVLSAVSKDGDAERCDSWLGYETLETPSITLAHEEMSHFYLLKIKEIQPFQTKHYHIRGYTSEPLPPTKSCQPPHHPLAQAL